ncbi:unnamed protein product [Amoebophrya sp. A120]|nr:unnamed protein product [Amoebophrya sp. A120]|eukprot:GSA120T00003921001.1
MGHPLPVCEGVRHAVGSGKSLYDVKSSYMVFHFKVYLFWIAKAQAGTYAFGVFLMQHFAIGQFCFVSCANAKLVQMRSPASPFPVVILSQRARCSRGFDSRPICVLLCLMSFSFCLAIAISVCFGPQWSTDS